MAGDKFVGGVRLHHRTLRNTIVVLPVPHRPYKVPFMCPTCGQTHKVKTYHINLDNEGDAIVSREIVDRLKEIGLPDFEVLNVVRNPPRQSLDFGAGPIPFRLTEKKVG